MYSLLLIASFADVTGSEIIDIDGTQVEVVYFTENGMKCEGMRILEQPKKTFSYLYHNLDTKTNEGLSRAEILNRAENILENRVTSNEMLSSSKRMASSPFWQAPKSFSITGYCPRSSNVLVTSLGSFYATTITPFHLKVDDGYCKGLYLGSSKKFDIFVRETYEKKHATVSWSYPPAMTVTSDIGSTMQVKSSDLSSLKFWRLPVEANSLIAFLSLKVTSETIVLLDGIAYPANVSTEKSVTNFVY